MENKVDLDKLEYSISELRVLKSKWNSAAQISNSAGKNSGGTVFQLTDIKKTIQELQNELVSLIENTISCMEQRKNSIQAKEDAATQEIKK